MELEVQIGDFVIVKYPTKQAVRHYAGYVEDVVNGEYVVSFLRKVFGHTFTYPKEEDVDTIEPDNIVRSLPKPSAIGSTKRSSCQLQFQFDFSPYNMF